MRIVQAKDFRDAEECTPVISQHYGLLVTCGSVGHFSTFRFFLRAAQYSRNQTLPSGDGGCGGGKRPQLHSSLGRR
jgi:hypothetical protein